MKKIIIMIVLVTLLGSGIFAQTSDPVQLDNAISVDISESLITTLSMIGLTMPLDYQRNLSGNLGVSVGLTPTVFLIFGSYDDVLTDFLSVVMAAGPAYYLKGQGVSGIYVRARALVEYHSEPLVDALNSENIDSKTLNLGGEVHIGFNLLFGPFPNYKTFISPEVGIQYISYADARFNWGVLFGSAF